jgi:putative transposase
MVKKFEVKKVYVKFTESAVYHINYHVVFCPKYRKPVLIGQIKETLDTIFRSICAAEDWELIEMQIVEDHTHLFISSQPKTSPMEIIKKLKGISARLIFKKFPEFKKKQYWGGHLWNEGYYIGTAGVVTKEAIEKYIRTNSSDH